MLRGSDSPPGPAAGRRDEVDEVITQRIIASRRERWSSI
jgi:hypothetical protein